MHRVHGVERGRRFFDGSRQDGPGPTLVRHQVLCRLSIATSHTFWSRHRVQPSPNSIPFGGWMMPSGLGKGANSNSLHVLIACLIIALFTIPIFRFPADTGLGEGECVIHVSMYARARVLPCIDRLSKSSMWAAPDT